MTNRRKRPSHAIAALLAIALVGTADATAPVARTGASSPATTNIFQAEAMKLGAGACTSVYGALGAGVAQGSTFAVKTTTDKNSPGAHMIEGVVGMTYNLPELKGPAAGVIVAAPGLHGCQGQLVRVAPFQKPCSEVVRMLPPGTTAGQNLSGVPLYQLARNQGQALLISSGASCVVVTIAAATQT